MCESNAFIIGSEGKREVMRDVSKMVLEDNRAVLTDIIGRKLILIGVRVKEMDLIGHEIVFERI